MTNKPFKCTCGQEACQAYAETRKRAAQTGAAHVIAMKTFEIYEKSLPAGLSLGRKLLESIEAAAIIGENSVIVAGLIAEHPDILEAAVQHYKQHSEGGV